MTLFSNLSLVLVGWGLEPYEDLLPVEEGQIVNRIRMLWEIS